MLGGFPLGGAPLGGANGGGNTRVDLAAGSYALSGFAVSASFATEFYAPAGIYSVTGLDLSVSKSRRVDLAAGIYTLSGYAIGLNSGQPIDLVSGGYALSGNALEITVNSKVGLAAGNYAIAGHGLSVSGSAQVDLAVGSYVLAGASLSATKKTDYSRLPGREPVQIVEIQQPFCANVYGVSPCAASGGSDEKCYNTRSTCQDADNFALGSSLSLFFAKGQVADMGVSGAPYIIPSLVSVSTSPTKINLSASNPDAQGLGNRALCSITFQDHAHSDRRVDPYVDGRSWNPLDADRGSFWSRWLRRNKYRQNVVIKVYEGYAGQSLSEMTVRTYFLQSATWPDAAGRVTIQGKDVLAKIEERKAQAPVASPGVLYTAISDSITSFEVANAVADDYPASGTLRIGDEIMTYTGLATSSNGVTFSGVTRGTDGTTAAAHDVDDGVQECLRYTDQRVDDIIYDLLTTYGGVSASYLDTAGWAAEFDVYMTFYKLTTLITEPVGVNQLLSELQVQAMFYLWWDERASLVKMKSIRGIDAEPPVLTAEGNIIEGSFSISEKPRERASQVWIYYNQNDYVSSDEKTSSYKSQFVIADLESETDELYGEKSIRKIYARWIPTDVLAQNTASKIITRYVDIPSACKFRMDAKDRSYWVGDTVKISHHLDVDDFGNRRLRNWTIISAEEKVPGEIIEYTAEDTTLYGKIHYVMASGAGDYPGEDNAPFRNCYIGNAAGLLSDGTSAGRIS